MENSKRFFVMVSVLIALVLGFILGNRQNTEKLKQPVVVSYSVPAERADEIKNQLNKIFYQNTNEPPLGTAQVIGGGTLLVRAPEAFQAGIGQMMSQLSTLTVKARMSIHIDYWLITGEESKQSNGASFGPLSTVLGSIEKYDGARKFRVLEHLASNALDGEKSRVRGSIADMENMASLSNEHIYLQSRANSGFGEVNSNTQVNSGDYIVLGENSLKPSDVKLHDDKKISGSQDAHPTNVYHVLHVEASK